MDTACEGQKRIVNVMYNMSIIFFYSQALRIEIFILFTDMYTALSSRIETSELEKPSVDVFVAQYIVGKAFGRQHMKHEAARQAHLALRRRLLFIDKRRHVFTGTYSR